MIKKFYAPHVLAIVISLLLFISCAKDFLSNSDNGSGRADIGEAKSIFESTATDLREIDFGLSHGHKSTKCTDTKSVITPQWSKPFVVTTDKFTIFEVPLGGDVKKYASTQYRKDGVARRREVKKVTTKLILKKNNETGEYIYFIATMVGRNEDKNVKDINYTNNRSFTGHIFISDLNGLCVGIYSCHSGLRQRSVFSRPTTKSVQNHEMIDGSIVQMFATPAAAYRFGETGGGDGGGGIVMDRCSSCGQPQTGTFCLNCNSVITTPDYCRKCNGPYNNCYCCFICKNYPCTCYSPTNNCSYCGSYYCNGECRNVCYYCGSRSCSGSCQSSGGGGGGTNPDPEESCGDAKCPDCKKCISTSKPNCLKCECKHDHKNCMFCSKCIKSNDDDCITRSVTHTTNCPTCDCVCPSCGAKINPNTMTFDCMIETSELFVSTGPEIMRGFTSAFTKLIATANNDKCEYGGLLSKFVPSDNSNISGIPATFVNPDATYLMVFWDKVNNSSNRSWTYKCKYGSNPKEYVLCFPNNKPTVVRYRDYANVHTHPSYLNINQGNIIDGHMSYQHLGVTSTDMDRINEYGCLYILNENNVYELKEKEYGTGKAKIIYSF